MSHLRTLAIALVAIGLVLFGRFYWYVNHGASPYDEVGIGLAGLMPGPIRDWGCARLDQRFPRNAVPPMHCSRATVR